MCVRGCVYVGIPENTYDKKDGSGVGVEEKDGRGNNWGGLDSSEWRRSLGRTGGVRCNSKGREVKETGT